jgi:magnesium and cobalt transporter
MDGSAAGLSGAMGVVAMTVGSWLGAMMLGGLMTAHYRVNGLYRNGLIEKARLGHVLRDMLEDDRRFQVTIGLLYLTMTLLGAFGWGHLLSRMWSGALETKFHLLFAVTAVLAWSLGGLVFKMLAADTALIYARVVGAVVYPFNWMLRPWSSLMLAIMNRLDDTLWATEAQPHLSAGEIRNLINTDGPDDTLDDDEREMIQSIFSFHDTAVREIMIPRIDMVVVDGALAVSEALAMLIEEGHSRVPVYEGGVDRIVGILYAKDLLTLYQDGGARAAGVKLAELAREAYFIPESKKIDEVLDEFRAKRIHMAVVIDEYGGTAGLVTLEDVIEEIVGEIEDEFDEEEHLLTWIDARTVRLDPKINLEDLEEELGVTFAEAEGAATSETLGGLIYEAAGNVPSRGDAVTVAGFQITVEEVADQRLMSVLMRYGSDLPGFVRSHEPEKGQE